MITMLISVNASAAVYDGEPGKIEITGGIKMDKAHESTFNDTRTITGRSECGTNIIINVCTEDEDGVLQIVKTYSIEVGLSGYFSKSVRLYEGDNIIVISTEDNTATVVAHIKRKSEEIKNMLERGIYIPGSTARVYFAD